MKYSLSGSLAIRFLCGASLCTAASLPPTTQFFSEVFIVSQAQSVGISMVLGLFVYLFLGGLVPVFLLGSLLTRHYNIRFGVSHILNFFFSVSFLVL